MKVLANKYNEAQDQISTSLNKFHVVLRNELNNLKVIF